MKKNLILVTGAAGAEGGSLTRVLLTENNFAVRILTRNTHSQKAQELKKAGAELAEGDLEDIGSLLRAMKDCYGVFGATGFRVHYEKEFQMGINLIDAVRLSGIRHLVLRTQPDYSKLSDGRYPTPQYDVKAALQRYSNGRNLPATFVQTGFYYENFFSLFPPRQQEDGSFYFGFPQGETKLPMTSADDVGGVVASIFNHPAEYISRTVVVVGANENPREYARKMSKVFKRNIQYEYIPRETYIRLGLPGGEETANMFEVQRLYIPDRQIYLIESYGLNPRMQTFQSWLLKNREKFNCFFKSPDTRKEVEAQAVDSPGVH